MRDERSGATEALKPNSKGGDSRCTVSKVERNLFSDLLPGKKPFSFII